MLPSDHLGPQQIQRTTLAQAYMRLPDSSIHRISILFHTLYNKQRKVTDSPQNTVHQTNGRSGMVFFAILKCFALSTQPIQFLISLLRKGHAAEVAGAEQTAWLQSSLQKKQQQRFGSTVFNSG